MNTSFLKFAFALYGLLTLTTMAGMSLGAVFFLGSFVSLVLASQSFRDSLRKGWRLLGSHPEYRSLGAAVFFYLSVVIASIVQARLWPFQINGVVTQLSWGSVWTDLGKLWYYPHAIALLMMWLIFDPRKSWTLTLPWLGFSVLLALWSPVQFVTGIPGNQSIPELPGFFHARGLSGHHLSAASILIFPLYAFLALFAGARARVLEWNRSPYWFGAASALLILFLFLGWSRMLWVSLPAGLFIYVIGRNKKAILPVILAGFISLISLFQLSFVKDRLTSSLGVSTRVNLWEKNIELFLSRPILGVGWRKTSEAVETLYRGLGMENLDGVFISHAHNMQIELLAGTGVLGFFAWAFLNYTVLRISLKSAFRGTRSFVSEVSWAFFCAWITLLLNGLTQVNFWEGKVQHQMMWSLALYLALKLRFEDSEKFVGMPQEKGNL